MQEYEKRKEHGQSILSSRADREGIGERDKYQLGSVLLFWFWLFAFGFRLFFFKKSVISVQSSMEITAINRLWMGVDFLNQG